MTDDERFVLRFQALNVKGRIAARRRLADREPGFKDWHWEYVAWYEAMLRDLQARLREAE